MFITKWKVAGVALVALTLAGHGTRAVFGPAPAAGQASEPKVVSGTPAKPAADTKAIDVLVGRLKSDSYHDREKAAAELERIGAPALDALRRGSRSGDAEQGERAAAIARKIEEGLPLVPKRVRLVFKDTPVTEAVAEFERQSGYDLEVSDPKAKLTDRRITLDTGEVTFWQAVDRLCSAGGLVAIIREVPGGGTFRGEGLSAPWTGSRPMGGGLIRSPQMVFADGKPPARPTDGGTSIRVHSGITMKAVGLGEGVILLDLIATPEPTRGRLHIVDIRIRSAIDDKGQELIEVKAPLQPPGGAIAQPGLPRGQAAESFRPDKLYISGGWGRVATVPLKTGPKSAKSLSEVTGTITVRVPAAGSAGARGETVTRDVPFLLKDVLLP